MDLAFYRHRTTFELLPSITLNRVEGSRRSAWCVMLSWLEWTLDIQWETKNKEPND